MREIVIDPECDILPNVESPDNSLNLHFSQRRLIGARFSRLHLGVQDVSRLAVIANVLGGGSGAGGGLGLGGGWISTRVRAS